MFERVDNDVNISRDLGNLIRSGGGSCCARAGCDGRVNLVLHDAIVEMGTRRARAADIDAACDGQRRSRLGRAGDWRALETGARSRLEQRLSPESKWRWYQSAQRARDRLDDILDADGQSSQ